MIERFISIKNVGKFIKYKTVGDVAFRRLTLIYGENGRGKTTLCDIVQSLKTNDGDRIAGRKTLGSNEEPSVEILVSGSKLDFKNGSWSQPHPMISIYDSTFIHENIYEGDSVDHEHKKNLYRVIVGEHGVKLAREVDELDAKIRGHNNELNNVRQIVLQRIPSGINLDSFIKLEYDPEIDRKIKDVESIVAALSEAAEIKKRSGVTPLVGLPSIPEDEFRLILTKTFGDMLPDAEQIVREHLSNHIVGSDESWLSQGLSHLSGSNCPFCGQSIDGVSLIDSYRAYFSESYEQFKRDISTLQSSQQKSLGDLVLLGMQKTLLDNQLSIEFWKRFVKFPDVPKLDIDKVIRPSLLNIRDLIDLYLTKKLASPLEPLEIEDNFNVMVAAYEETRSIISRYNSLVSKANVIIEEKKKQVDAGDLENVKSELQLLNAKKIRYEDKVNDACQHFNKLMTEKESLEKEKNRAKKQLDDYSKKIFEQYETKINQLLKKFNAGFRITSAKRQYYGGSPSSSFELLINNIAVDLGKEGSPYNTPSFKNTLSSGDRNTLALAFFLVQLERDTNLVNTVVVFDDPFTSQDRSRRTCTQQQINNLVGSAKQVIVLSHEPTFLRKVWDAEKSRDCKTLQLTRMGSQNTAITEWDIKSATNEEYTQQFYILTDYLTLGNSDRRLVAKTIRPLLEHYIEMKFPGHFGDKKWLGEYITKIREANESSPLYAAKEILEELEAINDYSKAYHHKTNPGGSESQLIDEGELEGFVKRTLDIVGGF